MNLLPLFKTKKRLEDPGGVLHAPHTLANHHTACPCVLVRSVGGWGGTEINVEPLTDFDVLF
jgi:hypothetical protein